MASAQPTSRRAFRRTDTEELLTLVTEALNYPLPSTFVLIKVHAVSLNWRDVNITHGCNPWPVIPNGIPGSDAAGEVIHTGRDVKHLKLGDRVTTNVDQASITGREQERCWLVADVDGVLADFVIFDEKILCKVPSHLGWNEASTLPCAGVTAWNALKEMKMGNTVLIQGTGGVSMMALKLSRAAGCKVIVTSSSDDKLRQVRECYSSPPLLTVNYRTNQAWHEEVVRLNGGVGVDIVVENGGTSSLCRSIQATRRGGTISQVGYLGKQDGKDLEGLLPLLIDRRVNLR